jgi:HK97 family phage portal protein
MGFFQKLLFRGKHKADSPTSTWLRGDTWDAYSDNLALGIPAVYACTRVLAETIASMPLVLYRKNNSGGRDRAEEQDLFEVARHRPNTYQTGNEFREYLMTCLCLRGNSYAYIERDHGRVVALWPLRPDCVQVEPQPDATITYRYFDENQSINYGQDEVLHIKGLSTDGVVGLSPISTLRRTLELPHAIGGYMTQLFKQQAKPSGVIKTPMNLDVGAANRLRDDFERKYSGPSGAGKTIVLDGGLEYQQIGLTNEDAETLATWKWSLEEVARAFRVPVHLLGHLDRMSFNNVEQLAREFLNLSLMPWLTRIESRFNLQLLTEGERADGLYFEHVTANLLRAGTLERFQAYELARKAGLMTANEIRGFENLPRHQDGESLNDVKEAAPG